MAGSLSDYAEELFLNHIFNTSQTAPSAWYLALYTATPSDAGGGTECTVANGYIRKAIDFSAASSRTITQNGAVNFNTASGSWGTVTNWGIFDAESAGNLLAWGDFNAGKAIGNGNTPSVADASIVITVSAGGISNYAAPKMLDWLFNGTAWSQPSIYVGLWTATLSDSSTGATAGEPSGNGYARTEVAQAAGWDDWAAGVVDNTSTITMGPPTGSWGTITDVGICDNASTGAGNLLFYDPGAFSEAPGDGDTVTFAAGALDITLD